MRFIRTVCIRVSSELIFFFFLFFPSPALQTNSMKRVWNTNYVKAAVNTVARSNSAHSIPTWIIRERPANRSKFSTPSCDCVIVIVARPRKKIKGQRNGRQREERRCLKAYFAVRNAAKEGWNAPLGNSNHRGAFSLFFFFFFFCLTRSQTILSFSIFIPFFDRIFSRFS